METSEFKQILRPLIRQTVKEVILDEGLLSGIITEVAKGLQSTSIVERKTKAPSHISEMKEQEYERERQNRIKRLNEASQIGGAFNGTQEIQGQAQTGPLSGVSPRDSGVDITAIEKIANGKWKRLI
jgi:hypothetical protein